MSDKLRCCHCGDVIGVYEPLVEILDGRVHETSRALEPNAAGQAGDCYHRACFERLDEDQLLTG
jgi:hypothetical protein